MQIGNLPLSRGDLLSAGRQLLQQMRRIGFSTCSDSGMHTRIGPCVDSRWSNTKALKTRTESLAAEGGKDLIVEGAAHWLGIAAMIPALRGQYQFAIPAIGELTGSGIAPRVPARVPSVPSSALSGHALVTRHERLARRVCPALPAPFGDSGRGTWLSSSCSVRRRCRDREHSAPYSARQNINREATAVGEETAFLRPVLRAVVPANLVIR